MLTIRWDTVMIIAVVGLSAGYLLVLALLHLGAARLIRRSIARSIDEPSRRARYTHRRRPGVSRPRHLKLHRDDDADHTPRTPPRRQVS